MRLVCPRCGAQYEIDGAAIPPAGRDVECSACDHVWRALPTPESFDPAARPQLSRPLSDSVIEILREEAARELEVRAAERRALRAAERAAAALAEPGAGEPAGEGPGGEPASGMSLPPAPAEGPSPRADAQGGRDEAGTVQEPAGSLSREVEDPLPSMPTPERPATMAESTASAGGDAAATGTGTAADDASSVQPARPLATAASSDPVPARPLPPAPAASSRRGYAAGFGLAVIAALAAVALYALAPRLGGTGPLGTALAGWRSEVDQGRDWLAARGAALTGRPDNTGGSE